MKARDVAEKIERVASKAWEDSQVMPTDEAVQYLQDALDVCRQLGLQLVRAYDARALRRELAEREAERYRVEL